jgi:hypothetical protein
MRMTLAPAANAGEPARISDSETTMLMRLLCGVRTARTVPAIVRGLGAALLCLLTSACFPTPERPTAGADPSNPIARVPATAYRPVLGGYVSQRPVEPAPWREQNDRVAPSKNPAEKQ